MLSDIRVLLVDDHAISREGIRLVLDAQPGISVISEADDGRDALDMAEKLHPDVVVMDIAMPNMNGAEATRQIRRRFPQTRVVILRPRLSTSQAWTRHVSGLRPIRSARK